MGDGARHDDGGLAHLAGLTNLTWPGLSYTQVTDAGVEALRKKLPKLEVRRWRRRGAAVFTSTGRGGPARGAMTRRDP